MGLFDEAPSYEDLGKKKGGKFLTQGVHLLKFAGATLEEAKSNNKAVALNFLTGLDDKDGEPGKVSKNYWVMDKSKGYVVMKESSLANLRKMLFLVLGLKWEDVTSIASLEEKEKLAGMVQRINKLTKDREIEACITYGWPEQPNNEGKYYQEVLWVNPARDYEYRKDNTTFAHGSNPNKRDDAPASGSTDTSFSSSSGSAAAALGIEDTDGDLPF